MSSANRMLLRIQSEGRQEGGGGKLQRARETDVIGAQIIGKILNGIVSRLRTRGGGLEGGGCGHGTIPWKGPLCHCLRRLNKPDVVRR